MRLHQRFVALKELQRLGEQFGVVEQLPFRIAVGWQSRSVKGYGL